MDYQNVLAEKRYIGTVKTKRSQIIFVTGENAVRCANRRTPAITGLGIVMELFTNASPCQNMDILKPIEMLFLETGTVKVLNTFLIGFEHSPLSCNLR